MKHGPGHACGRLFAAARASRVERYHRQQVARRAITARPGVTAQPVTLIRQSGGPASEEHLAERHPELVGHSISRASPADRAVRPTRSRPARTATAIVRQPTSPHARQAMSNPTIAPAQLAAKRDAVGWGTVVVGPGMLRPVRYSRLYPRSVLRSPLVVRDLRRRGCISAGSTRATSA